MDYDLNTTLEQTRQLTLIGNIIPHSWYSKIKFPSGTADLLGTVLLAEIVYWYRPVEIKDERTGQLIGYRKKFAADMLQRSLSSFSEQFGSTKRQVADALKRLEDAGLIIKQVRTIEAAQGRLSNVLYIAPIPKKIAELDQPSNHETFFIEKSNDNENVSRNVSPATFKRSTSYDRTYELPRLNVPATTPERSTYTEITTKITTENTAAEKCIAADVLIGEKLTEAQIKIIQTEASELCKNVAVDHVQLSQEIEFVILSNTAFSNASHDFYKKLNTIKKVIKEGRWNTPAGMIEKKQMEYKKTIDPIKRELNEAALDAAHWEKMISLALEKGQKNEASNFDQLKQQAQKKINDIKSKMFSSINNPICEGI